MTDIDLSCTGMEVITPSLSPHFTLPPPPLIYWQHPPLPYTIVAQQQCHRCRHWFLILFLSPHTRTFSNLHFEEFPSSQTTGWGNFHVIGKMQGCNKCLLPWNPIIFLRYLLLLRQWHFCQTSPRRSTYPPTGPSHHICNHSIHIWNFYRGTNGDRGCFHRRRKSITGKYGNY